MKKANPVTVAYKLKYCVVTQYSTKNLRSAKPAIQIKIFMKSPKIFMVQPPFLL